MKKSIVEKLLSIVIITIFCSQSGTAQKATIEYIYNEKNVSMPVAILFKDTISSKIVTFDIIGSNPFNNYDFEVIFKDFWGWNIYKFTKDDYEKIIPKKQRGNYLPEIDTLISETPYLIGDGGFFFWDSRNQGSKNIVLSYSFVVFDASGELYVGATAYYYLMSGTGKILHISKSLGVNINQIYISEDDKYVGFNYGGAMNNEYIHEGVRIYSAIEDSLIMDIPIKEPNIVGFIGNKLIATEYNYGLGKPTENNIYFLDAKSGEIGKYTFQDRDAWLNSGNMERDNNGLYFKNIRGEKLDLLFYRDFIKTNKQ